MVQHGFVETDSELARILGVTPRAVRQAELRGRIARAADGRWDVLAVVDDWRRHTHPLLQRHGRGQFKPWLDPMIPLTSSVWHELIRRAEAAGVSWR